MNQHEMEAAQAFHAHEMNVDGGPSERRWMRWLRDLERATGIKNLDGNRVAARVADGTADAACLDECSDWFDAGWSVTRAATAIMARPNLDAQREWPA